MVMSVRAVSDSDSDSASDSDSDPGGEQGSDRWWLRLRCGGCEVCGYVLRADVCGWMVAWLLGRGGGRG